ncbi:MAG: FkbM family methyltransferase [Deltaproteobacteria bacterium]|nr:FkbM family methyltransferase [Deltaproteobacteria bacterium]
MKPLKSAYYFRSLAALARHLRNPFAAVPLLAGMPATVEFRAGITITLLRPIDLLIAKETLLDDSYRLRNLRDPRYIIDIGASVGDFALAAAKRFPKCSIAAFEPDPRYFKALTRNIKAGEVKNVSLFNEAVGESAESAFRRLLQNRIDLVKIDCEGAEIEILSSLSAAEFANISAITMEYHRFMRSDCNEVLAELLSAHGFCCQVKPDRYDPCIGYIYAVR